MKNFIKGSLYFFAFLVGGILFQISCSNDDQAASPQAVGKFIYTTKTMNSQQAIWVANLDGSNATQVPISLPPNFTFYSYHGSVDFASARISPDGNTIIFAAMDENAVNYLFSCNIDGSNLQQLTQFSTNTTVELGNVI